MDSGRTSFLQKTVAANNLPAKDLTTGATDSPDKRKIPVIQLGIQTQSQFLLPPIQQKPDSCAIALNLGCDRVSLNKDPSLNVMEAI
ncbi:hypothetical protein AYI83_05080 [Shewanella algae]|nr:hypothetical protein AYI83_05080 [Shewanella algae]